MRIHRRHDALQCTKLFELLVARWIALTNYGIVTSFTLAAARMYKQHCHEEKQIYTWRYMVLDGVLGLVLPLAGCILQLFTQINTIHFTLSGSESAAGTHHLLVPDVS